ncbi:hypothetical protein CPB83DRAFT_789538 [Crepidotus variabilis]|uniref:Uncharacterized protein n=1 Tax=Crepidotus variabilis TaxID=179855 RepID=A0A9P6EHH1_9AGAR|nr:hypothetical protein CPB83DRAFT_789538 [Crepidotus variabilis]
MTMVSYLLALASPVLAEYQSDPYLAYRPNFARSLPVQIMLTGIVLTLVAVLFIHLMFTAQYHWPLAPVNYVLQLSGVATLLISLIATIHVVLSASFAESEKWPYMLSYIAVNVPPLDLDVSSEGWSIAERATWLVMNASTSGLIQITHIQFLTLLYPSRLEGRLIFALLGPLAVVAAVVQLLPISGNEQVNTIASAVRNVCNATLSLLFTIALFVWGLLVNRRQAWRTDGGTAVFGCAALTLALLSTVLNFLYIHKEDEYVWLPSLVWAVVLWQSFLGWWWWVGAGSGGGLSGDTPGEDIKEKLRREAKRENRRKEARDRRRETKIKAQRVWKGVAGAFSGPISPLSPSETETPIASSSSASAVLNSSADIAPRRSARHRTRVLTSPTIGGDPSASEVNSSPTQSSALRETSSQLLTPNSITEQDPDNNGPSDSASVDSRASSMTLTTSSATAGTTTNSGVAGSVLPNVLYQWYTSLRREHNAAARLQAAERVERIRERVNGIGTSRLDVDASRDMNGSRSRSRRRWGSTERDGVASDRWAWGWGWNGLGWRRGRSTSRRNIERLNEGSYEMESPSGNFHQRQQGALSEDERRSDEEDIYVLDDVDPQSALKSEGRRRSRRREQTPIEDLSSTLPSPPDTAHLRRPNSVWWWGPLSKWRLQDSTTY